VYAANVNACIELLAEALALQAAAVRAARSQVLGPSGRLVAAECAAWAEQDVAAALERLQEAWPALRLTRSGAWAETWPEAEGERRRGLLASRGHEVRARRHGSLVTLVYTATAPELLAPAPRRQQGVDRADVTPCSEAAHA